MLSQGVVGWDVSELRGKRTFMARALVGWPVIACLMGRSSWKSRRSIISARACTCTGTHARHVALQQRMLSKRQAKDRTGRHGTRFKAGTQARECEAMPGQAGSAPAAARPRE